MKLNAEDYLEAALEHLELAQRAYNEYKEYVVAYYYSGVAVESMLRAYMRAGSRDWYPRHGIRELVEKSRFLDEVPSSSHEEWSGRLSELNLRWRSENRYMSQRALRRYIVASGLDKSRHYDGTAGFVKGNLLKHNAARVLDLARDIVGLGDVKWKSLRK